MIRRGFWVTVGAAGGIMGYRRVARLGRRVPGSRGTGEGRPVVRRSWVLGTIRATREARSFTRDVREGMDLYMSRRPRQHPLPSVQAPQDNTNDVNVKDDR